MTTTKNRVPLADAMGPALQAKTARASAFDTLRATPRKARAWVGSALRTMHLDGAASAAADGTRWILQRALTAGRFLKGLGLINIAGFVLTWQPAREFVVKTLAKIYSVVRKPLEWAHRGLSWVCRKLGFKWGEKQVAAGAARGIRFENWVVRKVDAGMAWLTRQDRHPVMRGARGLFQASMVTRGTRALFPDAPNWAVYGFSAAVPTIGDRVSQEAVASEDAAIAKAKEVLKEKPAAEQPKGRPTPKRDARTEMVSIPLETVVLRDSELAEGQQTFEASSFVGPDDVRRYFLGSQVLTADDLPENITPVEGVVITGEVLLPHPKTVKVEETVREAQANPNGRPPTLPRAARRARPAKKAGASK